MTNLSPAICLEIKRARRAAGISQSALAAEVGCKQSALSMFEQGQGTKLNDEVIGKLARKFNIELKPVTPEGESAASVVPSPQPSPLPHTHGFCPNPHCPSNHAYEVEGRTFLRPDRTVADPVGGRFCALCGEVLEKRCPTCGASLHEGAVCSFCGSPYVAL